MSCGVLSATGPAGRGARAGCDHGVMAASFVGPLGAVIRERITSYGVKCASLRRVWATPQHERLDQAANVRTIAGKHRATLALCVTGRAADGCAPFGSGNTLRRGIETGIVDDKHEIGRAHV